MGEIHRAIIPAAGYGTRLGGDTPKPLVEIGRKPIIEHIISKIKEIPDISEIAVVTNQIFYESFNFALWLYLCGVEKPRTQLYDDHTKTNETRLGALRDIDFVLEHIGDDEDTLIIAGDNLFEDSLVEIYEFYKKLEKPVVVLHDTKDIESVRGLATATIDENNRIVEFMEKTENPQSTVKPTAIYFYPAETLKLLREYVTKKEVNTDAPGYFVGWMIQQQKEVYGYLLKGRWWDVGTAESLEHARRNYRGAVEIITPKL